MKNIFTREKKRILVIDDNEQLANNIDDFLTDNNYDVLTANEGEYAIKISKQHDFDLALVDLKLPDIKGMDLIKKLKEIQNHLEFIIITAHPTLSTSLPSVSEKSIISYMEKPLSFENLLLSIEQFYKRKSMEKESDFREKLLEYTSDMIFVTNIKGDIIYVNRSLKNNFDKNIKTYVGKNINDFADLEEVEKGDENFIEKAKKDGFWRGEMVKYNEVQDKTVLDTRIHLIKYDKGRPLGFLVIFTDISAQHEIKNELKNVNIKLQTILDNMAEMIFIMDEDGTYIDFFASNEAELALPPDQIIGSTMEDGGFGKNQADYIKEKINETLVSGESKRLEYTLEIDEEKKYFEAELVPFGVDTVLATVRNITERKKAEKNFQNLFNNTADAIFINERHGDIVYLNDAACEQTGYTKEELLNMNIVEDLNVGDPLNKTWEQVNEKVRNEESVEFIEKKRKKDGTLYWTDAVLTPVELEGKNVTMSINRDITKRIEVEKKLRESERKLRIFLNSSSDMVFLKDENLNYLMINKAYLDFLDEEREQVIGKSDSELLPKKLAKQCEKSDRRAIKEGKPITVEEIQNGKVFETRKFPVDIGENRIGVGGFIRDVTHKRKMRKTTNVLYSISHLAHETENVQELIKEIRKYLSELIDTKNFYVAMYNKENDTISLPYLKDDKDEFETFPAGKTLTKYVIESGRSQFLTEEKVAKLEEEGKVEQYGSESKIWLGVPLKLEDEIIGVMAVQHYEDPHRYSKEDLQILEIAAEEIAHTIHHQEDDRIIQESEERYRKLFNSSKDAIFVLEPPEWNFVSANPAAAEMFKMDRKELANSHLAEMSPQKQPDGSSSMEKAKEEMNKAVKEGSNFFEWQHQRANGENFPATVLLTRVKLKNKVFLQATVRDITERKETEEKLRRSEQRFRSIYENSTVGMYRTTADGEIIMANPALVNMLGFNSLEDLKNRNLEEKGFAKSYSREEFKKLLEEEGVIKGMESYWYSKNGREIFVKESARAIKDAKGNILYYEGTVEDITREKEAERELQRQKEYFQSLFMGSPEAVVSLGKKQNIRDINPEFEKLFGYNLDEIKGKYIDDLIVPEEYEEEATKLADKVERGKYVKIESVRQQKDGTTFPASIWASPIVIEEKEVGIFAIYRDISKRKNAEKKLRQSEEKYRRIFETSRDAIYRSTPDGKFLDMNQAGLEMLGYTKQEILNLEVNDIYYNPEERLDFIKKMNENGYVKDYELALKTKEGEKLYCLISSTVARGDKGEIISYEGIIKDITERKKAELALKKSQEKYKQLSEKMRRASVTDELTGVANRRHFNEHLEKEWKRAIRENEPISLIIFDVDYFKTYNDNFGHLEGDKCLEKIAKATKDIFKRPADLFARYGGDEFTAILPNTDKKGVLFLAEECRRCVEILKIENKNSPVSDYVTITLGCATLQPNLASKSEKLIKKADNALYKAKQEGRNRVGYKK
ncbi:MAG: PAS domain S-box protein [Candidatus Cloacimonetes bacterium]|nr:PAS domain S-box protein [Candidatus Cloacimonadota bacterium]